VTAAVAHTSAARPFATGPAGLPRLLAGLRADGRAVSLRNHVDAHGMCRDNPLGEDLIALVEASGLTGRGGASFSTGTKLRAVAEGGRQPVVLVNGAESEPLSGKDRALLRSLPHQVLDGAVLAAAALDAKSVFVAVGRAAEKERAALEAAIVERRRVRADDGRPIQVHAVPEGFVTGEETALVNFLNGGPAKPTLRPPNPFERGLGGAPTLVLNVETFAHVAQIAGHGAAWFRELGTPNEPGSTLVTLAGAVRHPGVYEVALGTPLANLLEEAGSPTGRISALLFGGYFGSWVSTDVALRQRLLDADLTQHGAALGARTIVALPANVCALANVARVARLLETESAGQCGPCTHGLAAIADGLDRIVMGTRDERTKLRRWVEAVRGRGACRHPDGATRFVASALDVFADEVELHLRHGRCGEPATATLPLRHAGGRS
jgi:NADH:ubiquinone oxidoreductase subunit F (NADH-binding)